MGKTSKDFSVEEAVKKIVAMKTSAEIYEFLDVHELRKPVRDIASHQIFAIKGTVTGEDAIANLRARGEEI